MAVLHLVFSVTVVIAVIFFHLLSIILSFCVIISTTRHQYAKMPHLFDTNTTTEFVKDCSISHVLMTCAGSKFGPCHRLKLAQLDSLLAV